MASLVIEYNDAAFNEAMRRLQERGDNLRPLFFEIGAELLRTTRERFDNQEEPSGKQWDPLSVAYARWKSEQGVPVDKILHYSLDMRDSVTIDVTDDQLFIGTNNEYAAAHQLGSDKKNIPARPFLGVSEDDLDFILEAATDYLAGPPNL